MFSGRSVAGAVIAWLVIGAFCFQFVGLTLFNRVDTFYSCPHTFVWTSPGPQSTTSSEEQYVSVEDAPLQTDKSVSGCAGSVNGLMFAQSQPLTMSGITVNRFSPVSVYREVIENVSFSEPGFVALPFLPPRTV